VVLAFSSLALYELQLPLLVLWPLVAALLGLRWRRSALVAWALIPCLYLGWRFGARPMTGASVSATARLLWDPLWIARRAFVLVPYNLFADGWWIAARQTLASPLVVLIAFAAVCALAVPAAERWPSEPTPSMRGFFLALGLIGLGVAPILPTTYWLGRTAGTYGARILAAAVPGAALLVLIVGCRLVRTPRVRALAFSAVVALCFAFHWNAAEEAAQNWTIQQQLRQRLRETASKWPHGSFLVVVDMPPNRLSFDTPFGVGRLIRETYRDDSLSGIGICRGRAMRDVLSSDGTNVLVMGGAYGLVEQARLVPLRWRSDASLERLPASAFTEGGLLASGT
jgi:hypothetical protein